MSPLETPEELPVALVGPLPSIGGCAPAMKARIISRASRRAVLIWFATDPLVHAPGRLLPTQAPYSFWSVNRSAAGSVDESRGSPRAASRMPSLLFVGATWVFGGHSTSRSGGVHAPRP